MFGIKVNHIQDPTCTCCGRTYKTGWKCGGCEERICDDCANGGRSGLLGKMVRVGAAVATYGASEVARAGYRRLTRVCPKCGGNEFMRI